jgi:hypothetical protein
MEVNDGSFKSNIELLHVLVSNISTPLKLNLIEAAILCIGFSYGKES